MPAFMVRLRAAGRVKELELNAQNPEVAKRMARRFGSVISVNKKERKHTGGGLHQSERYIFLWRVSTMLASKVGTTEALRLIRDSFSGRIGACAAGLLERVESGADLPTAISEDTRNFPGAIGMIIKVGAQTGQTWRALQRAAEFEHKLQEAKKGSSKGIATAVASFVLAACLMIFSSFYIGPKVASMQLVQAGGGTHVLAIFDQVAFWGGTVMTLCVAMLFGLMWLATVGRRLMPLAADAIILRIPFYSELVLAQDNYVNMHRMSLLVRSGVRMEDALKTSYESCRPGLIKEDFRRALDAIRLGRKWAASMHLLHPTDRAALMLASDREQIAQNLDNIGSQYESIYIERVAMFTPIMTVAAALSITVAGLVLFGQAVLPMLEASAGILSQN